MSLAALDLVPDTIPAPPLRPRVLVDLTKAPLDVSDLVRVPGALFALRKVIHSLHCPATRAQMGGRS